jgi:hypothetical protein
MINFYIEHYNSHAEILQQPGLRASGGFSTGHFSNAGRTLCATSIQSSLHSHHEGVIVPEWRFSCR